MNEIKDRDTQQAPGLSVRKDWIITSRDRLTYRNGISELINKGITVSLSSNKQDTFFIS